MRVKGISLIIVSGLLLSGCSITKGGVSEKEKQKMEYTNIKYDMDFKIGYYHLNTYKEAIKYINSDYKKNYKMLKESELTVIRKLTGDIKEEKGYREELREARKDTKRYKLMWYGAIKRGEVKGVRIKGTEKGNRAKIALVDKKLHRNNEYQDGVTKYLLEEDKIIGKYNKERDKIRDDIHKEYSIKYIKIEKERELRSRYIDEIYKGG